MIKNIRAGLRAVTALAAIPVFIGLTALQGFVVGPVFKNYSVIPNMLYNGLRRLLGYKVEFNKASAPVEKDKQAWYVANHMSIADFVVLGSKLNGTFIGKGDIMKWPGIAQMAQAVKFIGVRRSSQHNDESRGKIIGNFNKGFNAIMFPEGTTSDGKQVHLFRAALPSLLFGERGIDAEKREIILKNDVVVQPVAIRVKAINGKDARGSDELRNLYSMYSEENTLRRLWKRLQIRSTTLELTAFAPLDPANFTDAKEMINKAALDIASVVNPGQTTFEKKAIPGQPAPKA